MPPRLQLRLIAAASLLALATTPALAADKTDAAPAGPNAIFKETRVDSSGSVAVKGQKIDYTAVSGTIVVHADGWDDTAWREHAAKGADANPLDPEISLQNQRWDAPPPPPRRAW